LALMPPVPPAATMSASPDAVAGRSEVLADIREQRTIAAVLDAYRGAYERLDPVSAAALWPAVDAQALARAFGTIRRQSVSFDSCAIDVVGLRATAQCRGAIEFVPRVGDDTPQSRAMSWDFQLDRRSGQWRIDSLVAH
jgi:hypothetical protein